MAMQSLPRSSSISTLKRNSRNVDGQKLAKAETAAAGVKLATALTNMTNLVLEEGIPDEILPIFYGQRG